LSFADPSKGYAVGILLVRGEREVMEEEKAVIVRRHKPGIPGSDQGVTHVRFSFIVLAAFLGVVSLAGCSKEEPFHKPPVPVKVQKVEASSAVVGFKYSATLMPREQVELAFKVGGYVRTILKLPGPDGAMRDVQKGDHVTKGVVLAALRDSDYQAKLNHAQSTLEETRAALSQAVREFERAERLIQADVLSKNDYDKAKEKLDSTKARAAGAESQVEEARLQLQDTILKSPLDCLVVSRYIERGTLVASGTRAFVLADLSSMKVVFGVPDMLLKEIKPGDTVSVSVEALNNKVYAGVVTAISPSADPKSRVFEVEITVGNPSFELRDGMIASVHTSAAESGSSVPVVPLNAVVRPPADPKGFMVYVVEEQDGKTFARGRTVEIGKVVGNKVVITRGLSLGERIVTTGASLVYDSAVVTVIP